MTPGRLRGSRPCAPPRPWRGPAAAPLRGPARVARTPPTRRRSEPGLRERAGPRRYIAAIPTFHTGSLMARFSCACVTMGSSRKFPSMKRNALISGEAEAIGPAMTYRNAAPADSAVPCVRAAPSTSGGSGRRRRRRGLGARPAEAQGRHVVARIDAIARRARQLVPGRPGARHVEAASQQQPAALVRQAAARVFEDDVDDLAGHEHSGEHLAIGPGVHRFSRSSRRSSAMPMPPPMHSDATPRRLPVARSA